MSWFKKKGVVDLTKMKDKIPRESASNLGVEGGEVVDLSSSGFGNTNPGSTSSDNGVGFLGDLAGAGSQSNQESVGPITDSLREAREMSKERLKNTLREMKIKVEDTDYKMNDLVSRMRDMERRLRELERG